MCPRNLTRFAAGALVALGAVGLSACAPNSVEGQSHPSVSSEAVEPTPSGPEAPEVYERYSNSDFEWTDPLPADLESLNEMTAVEFAKQPKLEQLRWASWVGQYKDEFIDKWMRVNPSEQDDHYELTSSNDLMVMLQDISYQHRLAANFGVKNPERHVEDKNFNGRLNRQLAEKFTLAYWSGDGAMDRVGQFMAELQNNNGGQAINVSTQASADLYNFRDRVEEASDVITEQISREIDGVRYGGWVVQYTNEYGPQRYVLVAVPFTDYKGNQQYATVSFRY